MENDDNNDPEDQEGFSKKKQKRVKAPALITTKHLENVALYYLERFATSAENLRQVLRRRVYKSAKHHLSEPDDGYDLVDELITRYISVGLLDDQAYADFRVLTLRRRGQSGRAIMAGLLAKGVEQDVIAMAIDHAGNQTGEAETELQAAMTLARRRKLGRFGRRDCRENNRDKDLGKLARAGFSYDIALQVIDGNDDDDDLII